MAPDHIRLFAYRFFKQNTETIIKCFVFILLLSARTLQSILVSWTRRRQLCRTSQWQISRIMFVLGMYTAVHTFSVSKCPRHKNYSKEWILTAQCNSCLANTNTEINRPQLSGETACRGGSLFIYMQTSSSQLFGQNAYRIIKNNSLFLHAL